MSFIKRGEFIRLSFIERNLVTGNDDAIGDTLTPPGGAGGGGGSR